MACQGRIGLGDHGRQLVLRQEWQQFFGLERRLKSVQGMDEPVHRFDAVGQRMDANPFDQTVQVQPRQLAAFRQCIEAVERTQRTSLISLAERDPGKRAVGGQKRIGKAVLDNIEPVGEQCLRRGELPALQQGSSKHGGVQAGDGTAPPPFLFRQRQHGAQHALGLIGISIRCYLCVLFHPVPSPLQQQRGLAEARRGDDGDRGPLVDLVPDFHEPAAIQRSPRNSRRRGLESEFGCRHPHTLLDRRSR